MMNFSTDPDYAYSLDETDPLKEFRELFLIPAEKGKQLTYFLGNSLGLQPKTAQQHIQQVLKQWADWGVDGFFRGSSHWYDYHDKLTGPLAFIVGALPHEIVVMNQLTVNLHLMLASFYQPVGKRKKILCEVKAFPSDQYMLETHVRHLGFNPDDVIIELSPRSGEVVIRQEDILSAIALHADELALVFWGGVNYYTGQFFDMQQMTAAAHKAGAKAGFDLAHAAGNVPLSLHDWNVDFACWCSYKYLNAGPGAVGGVYIHERYHQDKNIPRLAGWWGYEKSTRFNMAKGFVPVTSAEGWHLSTPSMLQYATLHASLEIFEKAGMPAIVQKGDLMNKYFRFLLEEIKTHAKDSELTLLTPRGQGEKGNQVSLLVPRNGKGIFKELTSAGIMADWREPDVIRMAPVPLYNTFAEVWNCFHQLQKNLVRLQPKSN